MATKEAVSTTAGGQRVLVVCVFAPYNTSGSPEAYQEEFLSLIDTLGVDYVARYFCKIRTTIKAFFLTKGKLEEFVELCQKEKIEKVIFSERLSPLQERNLEDLVNAEIVDREQLILEIFRKSAHTAEGKIQVEMAEIEFLKTRIAGKGVEFMQQAGFTGGKGPGETMKEKLRRHFAEQMRQATKRIEVLQRSRDLQRKQRLQSNTPLISFVGYTNVGKSSLLNVLTKSDVLAENKLFATLDTTTRELIIDGKKKALISDTVGFISQLPHQLVKAFRSTLDELRYAHLLLHVVDLSNPLWAHQIEVVQETLDELGVTAPILYVFNKIDLVPDVRLDYLESAELYQYKPYVLTHAKNKEGIADLVEFLREYQFGNSKFSE